MTRSLLLMLVVLFVLLYLHSADGKAGGKYSKDKNRTKKQDTRSRQPQEEKGASTRKSSGDFRKSRSETKLERPRKPVKVDDERDIFEEVTLKKYRHDGGDKKEEESDVAAKLEDLLEKFDLLAAELEDLQEKYDLLTLAHGKRGAATAEPRTAEKTKKGRKVKSNADQAAIEMIVAAKLFAKAKQAGFSEQELMDLMTEFDDRQNLDQESSEDNFTGIREEHKDPRKGKAKKQAMDKVQVFREGWTMEKRQADSGRKLREQLDDRESGYGADSCAVREQHREHSCRY